MKLASILLWCVLPASAANYDAAPARLHHSGAASARPAPPSVAAPPPATGGTTGTTGAKPPVYGTPGVQVWVPLPRIAAEPSDNVQERPPRQAGSQTRQRRFLSTATPLPLATGR
jgi:hypothetical protein